MDTILFRWRSATVTRGRALQVGAVLLLLLLGVTLPYLSLEHLDQSFAPVRSTARVLGAGTLLGLDPTYFPSYTPDTREVFNLAFNVAGVAPVLQQLGSLLAVATVWGLCFDEINKFLWWPLHLSGYLLIAVPVPLLVGASMVRDTGVTIGVGTGWVASVLAGVVILVATLRSRDRIDTYGGV